MSIRHVFYEDSKVRFGIFDDNEYAVESKIKDPAKVRLSVDADKVESNLGMLSLNTRRADGEHDEWVTIGGRMTEAGGSISLAVQRTGGNGVSEVLHIDGDRAFFHVPLVAPNMGGGAGGQVTRFYTDGGRFFFNMQDDVIVGGKHVPTVTIYDVATGQAIGKLKVEPL